MLRKRNEHLVKLALDAKKARFTLKRNQIINYRSKSEDMSKKLRTFEITKNELHGHIKNRKKLVKKEKFRFERLKAIEQNTKKHLIHEKDVFRKNMVIMDKNKKLSENLEREIYMLETQLNKHQNDRIRAEKEQEKLNNIQAERVSEIEVLENELASKTMNIAQTKEIIFGLEDNLMRVMEVALQ